MNPINWQEDLYSIWNVAFGYLNYTGLHKNFFFIPLGHDYAFNYLLLRLLLRRISILPIGYCRYRFNLNLL